MNSITPLETLAPGTAVIVRECNGTFSGVVESSEIVRATPKGFVAVHKVKITRQRRQAKFGLARQWVELKNPRVRECGYAGIFKL